MRLFAALLPPREVVAALTAEVRALHALPDADALRWAHAAGWHVTLAFYGEVPDADVPGLGTRLERAARRGHPLGLRLHGGGRFADRALWAGITETEDGALADLAHLAAAARAAGRRVGAGRHPDAGPARYTPHLTLARARGARLAPFADALAPLTSPPWRADTLTLVRSHLPHSGIPGEQPRYEAVSHWPLGRPADRLPWTP
ncbi:RNA 2',3'-cyclic phosphodiesterase [Streptomyces sp. JJ66]|uniref:RNA 2',3'-cyclic phosphodiesterase n=1 Tax=Streptomyces sp. JJ66 TaxID=2803843 RepID=UPI001C55C949|nr:RNA 2',3'-cyclic phosphodiesterase [Streptomyces sp. JJ66]MBW1601352.1 RNA 2',3'-cyclic phosphodiesterase [Streptomyces sp. JJ66]